MHKFYAEKIVKTIYKFSPKNSSYSVLILGLTFKPNVPDYRNSRVQLLIKELREYNVTVNAYDPFLDKNIVEKQFRAIYQESTSELSDIDLVVLAVEHQQLLDLVQQRQFSGMNVISLKDI